MKKRKKSGSDLKPGTILELEEMNIFLRIPKEAVALEVTAFLLDENDELMSVTTKLSASMIRDRRQDFLDNVDMGDDYDARFVLVEKGREYLDTLEEARTDEVHTS